MEADIAQDDAGQKIGGQTGNIIAKFKGNTSVAPMILNAHMDTVEPGRGVEPVLRKGRLFQQRRHHTGCRRQECPGDYLGSVVGNKGKPAATRPPGSGVYGL